LAIGWSLPAWSRDPLAFRVALWMSGRARHLKAGEYRFDQPISPVDVIDEARTGRCLRPQRHLPEGLTIAEMSKIFESHKLGTAAAFVAAARDASPSSS
jgi:UPF0755 protein